MNFMKNKHVKIAKQACMEGFWCAGTAGVSALVLWYFLSPWLAATMLTVVIFHEFGHYFAGIATSRHVLLPFFIPLVYGVLGGTTVLDDIPESGIRIALAGPLSGAFAAMAIAVGSAIVGFWPAFWAATWMLALQGWSGSIGADGRKYRKWKKALGEFSLDHPIPA